MKLSEWVSREGRGALTRLQKGADKTFATVSRVVRGETVPDAETAIALSKATGGECTVHEILEEAVSRKRAREKGAA